MSCDGALKRLLRRFLGEIFSLAIVDMENEHRFALAIFSRTKIPMLPYCNTVISCIFEMR